MTDVVIEVVESPVVNIDLVGPGASLALAAAARAETAETNAEAAETAAEAAAADSAAAAYWPRTPNKFLPEELEGVVLDDFIVTGGTLTRVIASDGVPALQLDVPPSGSASVYRRFNYADDLQGAQVSSSVRVLSCEAAPAGSLRHIMIYRDVNGTELGRDSVTIAGSSGLSFDAARAASTLADKAPTALTVFVDWYMDLGNLSDAVNTRTVQFRDILIREGANAAFSPATPRPLADFTGPLETILAEAETAKTDAEAAAEQTALLLPVGFIGDLTPVLEDFQDWFSGTPTPYTISQATTGAVSISYAETDEASAAGTKIEYWVDPVGGDNANSGLTSGLPKKTVGAVTALSASNPKVIWLAPGIYYRDTSPAGVTYSHLQHMTMKPTSGRALLTTALSPAEITTNGGWTASGAAYGTPATSVGNVFDASSLDYRGVPRRYTNVANLAAVQALAGSWAEVSGTVYVRCFDGRAPDDDVLVNMKTGGFTVTPRAAKTVYFKDLGFLMGSTSSDCVRVSTQAATTGYFTAINCFFGGGGADALGIRNTTLSWLRQCTAAHGKVDGFSGTRNHALAMDVVEYLCHAFNAGAGGSGTTNNCSTYHEGSRVLRLGGVYYSALGPVVADVNGCKSLNINCSSSRSLLGSGAGAASWYANNSVGSIETSPAGKQWLVRCAGGESLYDISAETSAAQFYRNWSGPAAAPTLEPSTVPTRF